MRFTVSLSLRMGALVSRLRSAAWWRLGLHGKRLTPGLMTDQGGLSPVVSEPRPSVDPEPLLLALTATGMAPWDAAIEAMGVGSNQVDIPILRDIPAALLRSHDSLAEVLQICEGIARCGAVADGSFKGGLRGDPECANKILNAWLEGRTLDAGSLAAWGKGILERSWVISLPARLEVEGNLQFEGNRRIHALPEGLKVNGDLRLKGWAIVEFGKGLRVTGHLVLDGTPFRYLPDGLSVGGDLAMCHCPLWDGRIPQDVSVGRQLFTPAHLDGITLDDWRDLHPTGENQAGTAWDSGPGFEPLEFD